MERKKRGGSHSLWEEPPCFILSFYQFSLLRLFAVASIAFI